ncbi:hypothetical protein VNO78_00140 [Psophocarpus tetragonolobus]|uniref:Uncharacterized protein n=1 Tax=Psophocarpus tetragonolobus TaxID=3891 RepID=A0AAN9T015_PSOTE
MLYISCLCGDITRARTAPGPPFHQRVAGITATTATNVKADVENQLGRLGESEDPNRSYKIELGSVARGFKTELGFCLLRKLKDLQVWSQTMTLSRREGIGGN